MKTTALYRRCAAAPLFALTALSSLAQQIPDAGRLLNSAQPPALRPSRSSPSLEDRTNGPLPPALTEAPGVTVRVSGFQVTHSTAFPAAALEAELAGFVGQALSVADLRRATDALTAYYRARGYLLARAYLPEQDIRNGLVEIAMIEGRVGAVNLQKVGAVRLTEQRLGAALESQRGAVIRGDLLQRPLLLLNDLPGVVARATLSPGREAGTSDLNLKVEEGRPVSGLVDADNFGSRYTGVARVAAEVNLNDPSGHGDLATLRAQITEQMRLVRGGYQTAVGSDGLRLGVNGSALRYTLCCDFAPLQSRGRANELSVIANYPLLRSLAGNVSVAANLTQRDMFNQTIAGTTSDKTVRSLSAGLSGDLGQADALTVWSVNLLGGRADLSRWAPDLAADALSARVDGDFVKASYALQHERQLAPAWSLKMALNGQFASRNLDSSEQMGLGGPFGVRAYPVGEALGDEGHLLSLEARYRASAQWEGSAFLDQGWITQHQTPWSAWQGANTALPNHYRIGGVGAGINWWVQPSTSVRLLWAHKLGGNPGASSSGRDSDGRRSVDRLWLQLSMPL